MSSDDELSSKSKRNWTAFAPNFGRSAAQDREKRLPQCPVCGGRLAGQFRRCTAHRILSGWRDCLASQGKSKNSWTESHGNGRHAKRQKLKRRQQERLIAAHARIAERCFTPSNCRNLWGLSPTTRASLSKDGNFVHLRMLALIFGVLASIQHSRDHSPSQTPCVQAKMVYEADGKVGIEVGMNVQWNELERLSEKTYCCVERAFAPEGPWAAIAEKRVIRALRNPMFGSIARITTERKHFREIRMSRWSAVVSINPKIELEKKHAAEQAEQKRLDQAKTKAENKGWVFTDAHLWKNPPV